jgi:hypothetical protein
MKAETAANSPRPRYPDDRAPVWGRPFLAIGSSPVRTSFLRRPACASLLIGFVASVTAAAGIAAPTSLQQIALSPPAKAQDNASPAPKTQRGSPGGLNQQVRPASSRSKVTAPDPRSANAPTAVRNAEVGTCAAPDTSNGEPSAAVIARFAARSSSPRSITVRSLSGLGIT